MGKLDFTNIIICILIIVIFILLFVWIYRSFLRTVGVMRGGGGIVPNFKHIDELAYPLNSIIWKVRFSLRTYINPYILAANSNNIEGKSPDSYYDNPEHLYVLMKKTKGKYEETDDPSYIPPKRVSFKLTQQINDNKSNSATTQSNSSSTNQQSTSSSRNKNSNIVPNDFRLHLSCGK